MKQPKNIFFIAGLFVFVVIGAWFTSGGRSFAQESPISVETSATPMSETGDQILALLQELNVIQIDDSLFADPMFLSLQDHHVDLTEEPKERNNPFAPIGKDSVSIQTTGTGVVIPIPVPTKAPITPAPIGGLVI